MPFKPGFKHPSAEPTSALWFIFNRGKLLIKAADQLRIIPQTSDLGRYKTALVRKQYLGDLDGRLCFAAELSAGNPQEDQLKFQELRSLFGEPIQRVTNTSEVTCCA